MDDLTSNRFLYVVLDENGDPGHVASTSRECHDHISEAIEQFDVDDADKWIVRAYEQVRTAQPPFDARNALRYEWLRERWSQLITSTTLRNGEFVVTSVAAIPTLSKADPQSLDRAIDAALGDSVTKEPRRLSASEERSFTETALRSPRRVSDETSAAREHSDNCSFWDATHKAKCDCGA